MREITFKVYSFAELSDKAKEKAREWAREVESDSFGNFGELYEPYETAAKLLGITFQRQDVPLVGGGKRSDPCIWWRLHDQSQGASFEGVYQFRKGSVKDVRKEFPNDAELIGIAQALADLQRAYQYGLSATITTSHGSVHWNAMQVSPEADGRSNAISDEDDEALRDAIRDFARWIFKGIEAEWNARMEDAQIDDMLIANEYEFCETGKRAGGC